jgi:Holliday junction resolvase-like predicted endonuclease
MKQIPPRAGGAVHRFWVARIAETFRKRGLKVRFEAPVGEGRAIDLVAERAGEKVAVEVEVSGRRLKESIRKLAAQKNCRRVVACASSTVLERARSWLDSESTGSDIELVHAWSLISKQRTE